MFQPPLYAIRSNSRTRRRIVKRGIFSTSIFFWIVDFRVNFVSFSKEFFIFYGVGDRGRSLDPDHGSGSGGVSIRGWV